MRTLGLLGGMTYHATLLYYSQINAHIQARLGGSHSARIIMHSFDHAEMGDYFLSGNWDLVTQKFVEAAKNMKAGGAKAIVMCVNTGHKVADAVEKESGLEVLHIVDFSGEAIKEQGLSKVALLGTQPVMEEDFIVGRLSSKYGVEVIVPEKQHRDAIHRVIFGDLGQKIVTEETKRLFVDVVDEMRARGAEGIVLACTELGFVIGKEDTDALLFDTVSLHAKGAAEWSLKDD
jgi:aspartate racemase